MPQYTQIILDYWEYVEPERYARLRQDRQLLHTAKELADVMADEARRIEIELLHAYPEMTDSEARVEAEAIVIEQCLPASAASVADMVRF